MRFTVNISRHKSKVSSIKNQKPSILSSPVTESRLYPVTDLEQTGPLQGLQLPQWQKCISTAHLGLCEAAAEKHQVESTTTGSQLRWNLCVSGISFHGRHFCYSQSSSAKLAVELERMMTSQCSRPYAKIESLISWLRSEFVETTWTSSLKNVGGSWVKNVTDLLLSGRSTLIKTCWFYQRVVAVVKQKLDLPLKSFHSDCLFYVSADKSQKNSFSFVCRADIVWSFHACWVSFWTQASVGAFSGALKRVPVHQSDMLTLELRSPVACWQIVCQLLKKKMARRPQAGNERNKRSGAVSAVRRNLILDYIAPYVDSQTHTIGKQAEWRFTHWNLHLVYFAVAKQPECMREMFPIFLLSHHLFFPPVSSEC